MQFDRIYRLILDRQERDRQLLVLLSEETLREVYDSVIASGATECLELGTAFGATACVMAAAVEENGGGTVITVDHMNRDPIGVVQVAETTGMTPYVRPVILPRGYDWYLMQLLYRQTRDDLCEPCFDFCYIDGAHEWEPDALATLLVARLLRPGAWLMMDDLNYRFRGTETEPNSHRVNWSDEELDTAHIGMVYDLLVKTHPEFTHFTLGNGGHVGWARKLGGGPVTWQPRGTLVGPIQASRRQRYPAAVLTQIARCNEGVSMEQQDSGALIRSTVADPNVLIIVPIDPPQPLDFVTLRLRLVQPTIETMQLFWIGGNDAHFSEDRSIRCMVRASSGMQDLTFRFRGSPEERSIRLLRLDPGDGPSLIQVEHLTLGTF